MLWLKLQLQLCSHFPTISDTVLYVCTFQLIYRKRHKIWTLSQNMQNTSEIYEASFHVAIILPQLSDFTGAAQLQIPEFQWPPSSLETSPRAQSLH